MSAHIVLANPKSAVNIGGAIRAASCFGAESVFWTGTRAIDSLHSTKRNGRLRIPREERMKGYADVTLRNGDYPFDSYPDMTPVCVEVQENAEQLHHFVHPENAVYVFGPEDGSIPASYRRHCHRFVVIPSRHCTNLAAAVYITLYDRHAKRLADGLEIEVPTKDLMADEERGWYDHEAVAL